MSINISSELSIIVNLDSRVNYTQNMASKISQAISMMSEIEIEQVQGSYEQYFVSDGLDAYMVDDEVGGYEDYYVGT